MPRKPSLDGKDSSLRIRMSPEQKERLVSYAERHYQTMSNVIFQALDILYEREEKQNNNFGVYLFISGTENTKTKQVFGFRTIDYIRCVLYNAVRKGV